MWVGNVFFRGTDTSAGGPCLFRFLCYIFPKGLVHLLAVITFFLSSSSPFIYQNNSCSLSRNVLFFEGFFCSLFAYVFSVL